MKKLKQIVAAGIDHVRTIRTNLSTSHVNFVGG